MARERSFDASSASEQSIQARIILALGSLPNVRIFRTNAGKVAVIPHSHVARARKLGVPVDWLDLGPKGMADLTGLVGPYGRSLSVEVKSATGVQSDAQVAYQRVIEALGGIYILARSPESALAQLQAYDTRSPAPEHPAP
jgi:hypothetical protein